MVEPTVLVAKDGQEVRVSKSQVASFVGRGYEVVPEDTDAKTSGQSPAPISPTTGQVLLRKDGRECVCDLDQQQVLLDNGWSRTDDSDDFNTVEADNLGDVAEDEGSDEDDERSTDDAHEQLPRDDQELGRSEDGFNIDSEPERQ